MNKNRKLNGKRVTSVILTAAVLCTTPVPASVLAAEKSSQKEEVIYTNLDGNGNQTGTYAVNIFSGDDNIMDYGEYSQVHNMNTTDDIAYENGEIRIETVADKLYYEGIMEEAEVPWAIAITYKIDGMEYSADEIAGKSGALTMEINITENKKAKEGFFDNYALQTTVKLDTDSCKNIIADGATEANVGKVKQLTYTVLPGKGKDIVITSDVTNFEMDSIAINGIRLNLGISSDSVDTSKLTDKISDLQDAVSELDSGADTLNKGAGTLDSGAKKLKDGIETIDKALKMLNGKSSSLTTGSSEVKDALQTIQSSLKDVNISTEELTKLTTASTQIQNGIDSLVSALQTMDNSIDSYYSALAKAGLTNVDEFIGKNNQALAALGITDTQRALYQAYVSGGDDGVQKKLASLVAGKDAEAVALYQQVAAGNTVAVKTYVTTAGKLISIESLLKADIAYIQGSQKVMDGIDSALDSKDGKLMTGAVSLQTNYKQFHSSIQNLVSSLGNLASNMSKLKSGIDKLNSNYRTLDSGISQYTSAVNSITAGYSSVCEGALDLVDGTSALYEGTQNMVNGTDEFSNKTSGLEDNVNEEIDSMLDEYTGSDYKIVSFTSDKNTDVTAVQFVIQTEAIEKEDAVVEEKPIEESLSVWQKFLKLFSI